jgi:hypothetical protein
MAENVLNASPISADETAQRALILPEGKFSTLCGEGAINLEFDRFQFYLEVAYTQPERFQFISDLLSSIWKFYRCSLAYDHLAPHTHDVGAGFRHPSNKGTTWLYCLLFRTPTLWSIASGAAIGGAK